jgi:hypothetical protein
MTDGAVSPSRLCAAAGETNTADCPSGPASDASLAERLERGEVILYSVCPFSLPQGEDRDFLCRQALRGKSHKNIIFDPATGKVGGFRKESRIQKERLRRLLTTFSRQATDWLATILPGYARTWKLDRVSFRPEEEATRCLRLTARNDLLHIDAFPTRPTNGWRILRCFVNINPSEPRIWMTSLPFRQLLERYGVSAGLPSVSPLERLDLRQLGAELLGQVQARFFPRLLPVSQRSAYDLFMLRFHDYLKASDDFQERGPRRLWRFPPGSTWLALTDTCSHAVLRGRYALEHSYFVAPDSLAFPDESPALLLARTCGCQVLARAA